MQTLQPYNRCSPVYDPFLTLWLRGGALGALSLMALLSAGCSTTRASSGAAPGTFAVPLDPQRDSPEECNRRVKAMAQQAEEMDKLPQEIVSSSKPYTANSSWEGSTNPCPEPITTRTREDEDASVIARTQIDSALGQGDYARARALLPKLYTAASLRDAPQVRQLTEEVLTLSTPELVDAHKRADSIIMRDDQPVCVATQGEHPVHDDFHTLTELVQGPTVHIYCGVQVHRAPMGAQLRVRYRLGAGEYAELAVVPLGPLEDLSESEGVHYTLRLDEAFLADHEQAYIEAILMGLKAGETPKEQARGGFFWMN